MKSFLLFFVTLFFSLIFAQGKPYAGPEDPAGDPSAEREGYMTGNRVLLYFKNTTELSDWPATNASRWPNNNDGVKMVCLLYTSPSPRDRTRSRMPSSA